MWIDVCDSSELGPAAVLAVSVQDVELVLWRAADGLAHAGDRRCPHAWSDLATEGFVEGCELVCGSHHWRFRPDGTGVKYNMRNRVDLKAPLAVYPCEEADGRLWVKLARPGL